MTAPFGPAKASVCAISDESVPVIVKVTPELLLPANPVIVSFLGCNEAAV